MCGWHSDQVQARKRSVDVEVVRTVRVERRLERLPYKAIMFIEYVNPHLREYIYRNI
jgi:hypothetical protein